MVDPHREHPLAVPQHTVRAQQDEKRAVNINGGKAALGEPHKIQRQQHSRRGRHPRLTGQAARKAPRQRHQQHAEQRARAPPAKGRHTEQRNAQHDEILAQRRVGGLVNRHFVQLLIAGAAVVDFIKIHTVELADGIRHGILLIKQRPAACHRHQRPIRAAEGQLKQLGIAHRDGQRLPAVSGRSTAVQLKQVP